MSTPPPPNPYTQPQYPQRPQYPQYPQQGYAPQPQYQPPYPGTGGPAYGWGAPPPPPPKKNQGPKIALITMASIAGLFAVSWFGNNVVGGGSSSGSGSFPQAEYQLTLPETLLDGKYKLADDQSDKGQAGLAGTSEANIRDAKATVGQYLSTSESGVLVISGGYGRIKDPDEARTKILKGAGDSDGSTIAVPAKDFTPAGSEVTITCQVLTTEQTGGGTSTLPMCAWADDNTSAAVALTNVQIAKQTPEEVDLKAVAEATLKVREAARKPIG
ncbi:hypothetical protein ACH492_16200 [Streptomyces sp. NPDC019443]|uniref:hypothetical protein n=1 Tax=Streptomyces sp. NPDC019443 TaxID=3365061 RepID=UPI0037B36769